MGSSISINHMFQVYDFNSLKANIGSICLLNTNNLNVLCQVFISITNYIQSFEFGLLECNSSYNSRLEYS